MTNNSQTDIYDRQKRISGWNQSLIENSKVAVFGAGALGNETTKLLLQIGVKKITIVDYDTVSEVNLNRCLFFTKEDAANSDLKARVIARNSKNINPDSVVQFIASKIEDLPERSFFNHFDAVFGCLDNLAARLHANAHCYKKVPYIDGGTFGFNGKVQVVDDSSSCIECAFSNRDYALLWKKYSCVGQALDFIEPAMPALPSTTSIVASVAVNEFIKLIHKKQSIAKKFSFPETDLVGKYWYFNGLTNQSSTYSISKRKNCPVHL